MWMASFRGRRDSQCTIWNKRGQTGLDHSLEAILLSILGWYRLVNGGVFFSFFFPFR